MNGSDPAVIEAQASAAAISAMPLAVILLGIILGFIMAKGKVSDDFSSKTHRFAWKPFLICAGIALLGFLGQQGNSAQNVGAARPSSMKVAVAKGADAEPLPSIVEPAALREFEALVNNQISSTAADLGWQEATPPKVVSKATQTNMSGHTILRVSSDLPDFATVVQYAGVIAGKEINVVCVVWKPKTFVYEGSECEAKVNATFVATPNGLKL